MRAVTRVSLSRGDHRARVGPCCADKRPRAKESLTRTMPRVSIERFRQHRERPRCGLGACVDAVDLEQRGRPVVLKFLPPIGGDDVARFDEVARSLEPLRHAAIVQTLGHGLDGARPFLVLEPPDGRVLTELLVAHNDGARWPELADVRAIVDATCAAVAVAHRMRVVADAPVLHGLLSSHSVFVQRASADAGWEVSVTDFALSTLPGVAWRSAHDDLAGDPRAPELLADPTAVSCATDVFALAVLAVTLLVPFAFPVKPKSWAHFIEQRPDEVRGLLTSMRADLPPALCDELVKALALDPDDRHADADRLRTALRRVAWEPVREIAPPQRPVAPRAELPHDPEASSPQLRLPSALVAEPERAARFVRTVAAPAAPVADEVDETVVPPDEPFAENTVPTTSAIDALRALRQMERARDQTVIAPAPTRNDRTVVVPLPEGDLFADNPWGTLPPAPVPAVAVDDEDATLAEGSVPNDRSDHTLSEAWEADASAPSPPVDRTRIGRAPTRPDRAPVAPSPRPATLAPAPPPAWQLPTLPGAALLAEHTMEIEAPPAWKAVAPAPPPAPLAPSSPPRGLLVAAITAAVGVAALLLWWSLR